MLVTAGETTGTAERARFRPDVFDVRLGRRVTVGGALASLSDTAPRRKARGR